MLSFQHRNSSVEIVGQIAYGVQSAIGVITTSLPFLRVSKGKCSGRMRFCIMSCIAIPNLFSSQRPQTVPCRKILS